MPIRIENNSILAGQETISINMFSNLVEAHLRRYPKTILIEQEAIILMASNFQEDKLKIFIRHVCNWGGHPGIAGRIINQNPVEEIRNYFRRAISNLNSPHIDLSEALHEINQVRGLGTPSFASKHLRFLRPDICPILDSILSDKLNYQFDPQGYKLLYEDCLKISKTLESCSVPNPMNRDSGRWFVADVEMAVFAYINNLQGLTTG